MQYVGEADCTNAYYLVPQLDRQHTLKYALTRMLWTQVRPCHLFCASGAEQSDAENPFTVPNAQLQPLQLKKAHR